jgi:hypothetical protein
VNEGGFVQLIQNGYGGYIFDNPVAKALKQMGAKGLFKTLYKPKKYTMPSYGTGTGNDGGRIHGDVYRL